MNCRRTRELLSPLIDGELPLDLSRPVLAHLGSCSGCRARADSLRSLRGVVRAAGAAAPPGLGARVLSEARASQAGASSGSAGWDRAWDRAWVRAWPRAAALLAGAASVALLLGPLTSAPRDTSAPAPSPFQLLISESQGDLELAGSFSADFRALARRPEGRLMFDLTEDRR